VFHDVQSKRPSTAVTDVNIREEPNELLVEDKRLSLWELRASLKM
jgi:hypothetical protein